MYHEAPIYYAAVEHSSYASLDVMIRRLGGTAEFFQRFIDQAKFHDSDIVIVDQMFLGAREDKTCMGLMIAPGGAVKVLACYFDDVSENRGEVEAFLKELMKNPEFKNRDCYVGAFRPTMSRALPQ